MAILDSQSILGSAFNVDLLIKEARKRAGSTDNEMPAFVEALEVLAHALDTEARLSPSGRLAVREGLISALLTQIEVQRNLLEHPEIDEVHVSQPVFIIGMLRTGSTLVHNLLSQHPDLRVPNLWELMFPAKPSTSPQAQEALAARAQTYVNEYFQVAPRLKAIHFLDARRPDECHRLLGNAFQSKVYEMRYRVPSYSNWLRHRDLTEAYAYHQLQLKNILWRIAGDVVVLKCPFHAWDLGALVRVYPNARFINLHRDPTSIVLSTCSLCATLRAARSDIVDYAEIGQQWFIQIEQGLTRVQEARQIHLSDSPVLDIRYGDLMSDTIGIMKQICTFIGVPMTEQAEHQMRQYLAANQQNKQGVHRYVAEEFGLNPRDLDECFRSYRNHYKLS